MDHRKRRILKLVDPSLQTGIEIGALASPILDPATERVLYVDRLSSDDLRTHYAWAGGQGHVDLGAVVEVDVVVPDGATIASALGSRGPVDYVVASHVIEHVPNVIGWLRDVGACLRDGGLLCLAVPDKRFTFDHYRRTTQAADMIELHLAGATIPTPGQVYSHASRLADADAAALWRGETGARRLRPVSDEEALRMAERAGRGEFQDVHCLVFTPASFCEAIGEIIALDLIPFEFADIEPTAPTEPEFFATLRKRSGATAEERAARTPVLGRAHHALPEPPPPAVPPRSGASLRRVRRLVRALRRWLSDGPRPEA